MQLQSGSPDWHVHAGRGFVGPPPPLVLCEPPLERAALDGARRRGLRLARLFELLLEGSFLHLVGGRRELRAQPVDRFVLIRRAAG